MYQTKLVLIPTNSGSIPDYLLLIVKTVLDENSRELALNSFKKNEQVKYIQGYIKLHEIITKKTLKKSEKLLWRLITIDYKQNSIKVEAYN